MALLSGLLKHKHCKAALLLALVGLVVIWGSFMQSAGKARYLVQKLAQWNAFPSVVPLGKHPSPASKFHCTPLSREERLEAFGDLGGYTHSIGTKSKEAQHFFDQGMMLAYGFNQPEALVSFRLAKDADPKAPAPYWGIAYALGPFLNKISGSPELAKRGGYPVFSQQERIEGQAAIKQGLAIVNEQLQLLELESMAIKDTEHYKALKRDKVYLQGIACVFNAASTYGPPFEAGTRQYAQTLQDWAEAHTDDTDALAVAAEALANLQPWDFWDTSEVPQPQPGTPKVLDLLRAALDRNPVHPLALHIMIHATEAALPGPNGAGQGLFAADRLAGPAASTIGHLQHMPSHTYLNTGYWHKGVTSNEVSVQVDASLSRRCVEPCTPFHNAQVLIYSAMGGAEQGTAEKWARRLAKFPEEFGPDFTTDGKGHLHLPWVWLRFANWKPLLDLSAKELDPSTDGVRVCDQAKPFSKAMYHVFKSFAHAAAAAEPTGNGFTLKGDAGQKNAAKQKAYDELQASEAAASELRADAITKPGPGLGLWSLAYKATSAHDILMAKARLAVLEADFDAAVTHLEAARRIEVSTGYMEPPRFFQFSPECLGWVLITAGRLQDAAQVYVQGLREFPRSPWVLTGMKDVWRKAALMGQFSSSTLNDSAIVQSSDQHQKEDDHRTAPANNQLEDVSRTDLLKVVDKKKQVSEGGSLEGEQDLTGQGEELAEGDIGGGKQHKVIARSGLRGRKSLEGELQAGEAGHRRHVQDGAVADLGVGREQLKRGWQHNIRGQGRVEEVAVQQQDGSDEEMHLPPGLPTEEEVDTLLAELAAEAGGAAMALPSSCPCFSEPVLGGLYDKDV